MQCGDMVVSIGGDIVRFMCRWNLFINLRRHVVQCVQLLHSWHMVINIIVDIVSFLHHVRCWDLLHNCRGYRV